MGDKELDELLLAFAIAQQPLDPEVRKLIAEGWDEIFDTPPEPPK